MTMDKTNDTIERLPDAALLAAVRALSLDMHLRGTRPCTTCAAITKAISEPFGCDAFRLQIEKRKAANAKNQAP